jgi:hypothetical protein
MSQASSQLSASIPTFPTSLGRLWHGWQLAWIIGRTLFLVGFFFLTLHTRHAESSLLLTTEAGKRMLIQCVGLVVLGTGVELLLFGILNHWQAARPASGRGLRIAVGAIGEIALCVFCFLPAFFILSIGPAALGIMENLSHVQS